MRYLALLAALACPVAMADAVATNGKDSIRLTQGACAPEVLRHIPEGYRGFFRSAPSMLGGKAWVACWAHRTDGTILIVYEDGDQGIVPIGEFRDAPGV